MVTKQIFKSALLFVSINTYAFLETETLREILSVKQNSLNLHNKAEIRWFLSNKSESIHYYNGKKWHIVRCMEHPEENYHGKHNISKITQWFFVIKMGE